MVWQLSVIVVSERLEGALEVFHKRTCSDDLLSLLLLGRCLGVVLAHVLVISSTETDDTLLSLVANIDTDQHCLLRDLRTEVQSP